MTFRAPVRLREDPTTGVALLRDLARAPRCAATAVGYDTAAGIARFEASLAAAVLVTSAAGAGKAAAGSTATGTTLAVGSGAVGSVVIGATLGIFVVTAANFSALVPGAPPASLVSAPSSRTPPSGLAPALPASRPTMGLPQPGEPGAPPLPVEGLTASPAVAAPFPSLAPRASLAPTAPGLVVPVAAAPPPIGFAPSDPLDESTSTPPAPSSHADAIAREMEHLARLRALASTDPGQALAAADEGDRLFPGGVFGQERQALAIAALVRIGRASEARVRALAFKAAYPRSPFAERITSLTAAPTP